MTKTCPHCNQSGHTTRRSKHCGLHLHWLEESKKKEQERLKDSSSKAKRAAKLKASLDAGSPECMINIALKEINFEDVWSPFKRGNALEEGSAFAEALKENKGGCTLVLAQRVFEALRGISQEVVKGFTSANGVVEFLTKYEVGVLEYMNQKKLPGYDFDTAIKESLKVADLSGGGQVPWHINRSVGIAFTRRAQDAFLRASRKKLEEQTLRMLAEKPKKQDDDAYHDQTPQLTTMGMAWVRKIFKSNMFKGNEKLTIAGACCTHVPHSLRSKILGGSSEVPSTYEVTPVITCPVSIENDNRPCSAEDRAKSSADGNKCLCHEDRERQQRKRKVWMVCNSLCDLVAALHAGGGDQKTEKSLLDVYSKDYTDNTGNLTLFYPKTEYVTFIKKLNDLASRIIKADASIDSVGDMHSDAVESIRRNHKLNKRALELFPAEHDELAKKFLAFLADLHPHVLMHQLCRKVNEKAFEEGKANTRGNKASSSIRDHLKGQGKKRITSSPGADAEAAAKEATTIGGEETASEKRERKRKRLLDAHLPQKNQ